MQGEINSILDNVIMLIKECIAGNRNTQNRLYHSYATKMMTVCLRYTESRQDAEEILQEGFVKVFTCMHQYKFSGSLEGWIKKIMINCALQKLRTKNLLYAVVNIEAVTENYGYREMIVSDIQAKEMIVLIQKLPLMCRHLSCCRAKNYPCFNNDA